MLLYFHGGDLPLWVIIIFLLLTIVVPLAVVVLASFVIKDFLSWKNGKDKKDRGDN